MSFYIQLIIPDNVLKLLYFGPNLPIDRIKNLAIITKWAEQLEHEPNTQFESKESLANLKGLLEERENHLKLAIESSEAQVQQMSSGAVLVLSNQRNNRSKCLTDDKFKFMQDENNFKTADLSVLHLTLTKVQYNLTLTED